MVRRHPARAAGARVRGGSLQGCTVRCPSGARSSSWSGAGANLAYFSRDVRGRHRTESVPTSLREGPRERLERAVELQLGSAESIDRSVGERRRRGLLFRSCSVDDVGATLAEIRRVLRRGARLSSSSTWRRQRTTASRAQKLAGPIRRCLASVARMNRRSWTTSSTRDRRRSDRARRTTHLCWADLISRFRAETALTANSRRGFARARLELVLPSRDVVVEISRQELLSTRGRSPPCADVTATTCDGIGTRRGSVEGAQRGLHRSR